MEVGNKQKEVMLNKRISQMQDIEKANYQFLKKLEKVHSEYPRPKLSDMKTVRNGV